MPFKMFYILAFKREIRPPFYKGGKLKQEKSKITCLVHSVTEW